MIYHIIIFAILCHVIYIKVSYSLTGQYFFTALMPLNNITLRNEPTPGQYFSIFKQYASCDPAD